MRPSVFTIWVNYLLIYPNLLLSLERVSVCRSFPIWVLKLKYRQRVGQYDDRVEKERELRDGCGVDTHPCV